MSKNKKTLASNKRIYRDFERLYKADIKESKKISKILETKLKNQKKQNKEFDRLFDKAFREKFLQDERNEKRKIKKEKAESKKVNVSTKRKLIKSRLKVHKFYDKNNIAFISKQKDYFLVSPITITKDFLDNDFINFLFLNFSNSVSEFLENFKVKDDFLFTIGYHFYFEGLQSKKTFAVGFRPKSEMPLNISDILTALQDMFTEIKKRFDVYYLRANSHLLKFKGITLEASPK